MADPDSRLSISKTDFSTYVTSLPADAKERYNKKLLYSANSKSLPDPYLITENWSDDPHTWPDLTFGDIYLYLIDTPSIYTKESMKAYKSLDAYNYVLSGHVQQVWSNLITDDCPFIVLKAKVTPSQRARDKPHQPWVYLEKTTGTVYCAHCTCMAGLGEVCSHVGALLFKVELAVKMGLTQTSSTSKACEWNNTFRKEVTPTTVTDIFQQIKGKRKKVVPAVQAHGSTALPDQQVLDELFAIVPDAAFFTSINTPTQENVQQPTPNYIPNYPVLLSTLHQPDYNQDELTTLCATTYTQYKVTAQQVCNLELATRSQSVSSLWYQHRMGRVTGSKAHDVVTRRPTTPADNLVKRIVGYSTYDLSKKDAVKWGLDHEEECRLAYTKHQQTTHTNTNFTCELSGFVVNTNHPFIGASPDGIVTCQCCGRGTVEIKCPYKHRDVTVNQAAISDKDFCLKPDLTLKTNHRYYTQIQMQMFVTDCHYTDFVVFTKCQPAASMVIVRVPVDLEFCERLVEKCDSFVRMFVVKELITRRLENEPQQNMDANNNNSSSNNNEDDSERTWCICTEQAYGRMIRCDGDECPHEWFHYACVNVRRKPKGSWYCTSCEV